MKTLTITLYSFAELSEKAKERAHQDSLKDFQPTWTDENNDSLEAFCKVFPCRINRHDRFEYSGSDEVRNLKGQRLANYIWNNYRKDIWKGKYYHKNNTTRYSKIQIEVSCPFTGYIADHYLLDEIEKFLKKPDNRDFEELLNDCYSEWQRYVEKDYEYQQSMEAFAEDAEANGWTFTKAGRIVNPSSL